MSFHGPALLQTLFRIDQTSLYSSIAVMVLQPISSHIAIPTSSLTSSTNSLLNCFSEIQAKRLSLNSNKAVALANTSSDFIQNAAAYSSVSYSSIFDERSFTTSCVVTWLDVNVVFALHNSSGFAGWLVVSESPDLSHVLGFNIQHNGVAGSTRDSTNWAGWEFYGKDIHGNTAPIYEAEADYSQPTPSNPDITCHNYYSCLVFASRIPVHSASRFLH